MKQAILLTLLILFSCEKKDTSTLVQTETVELRTITEKVEGLGRVQPELEVNISSDVAGRIVYLPGLPGDRVKKGQVLARIDEKIYVTALQRAKSSQKSSRASLNKSKSEMDRAQELASKKLIPEVEYEVAKANYEMALASMEQANSTVTEAEENLNKCTVYAPIDGVITVKNKEEGEIAQGSSFTLDVIMIVANLNVMETVVDIVENDIVKIKLGQTVELEIDAYPNRIFQGRVREIANAANSTANSVDPVTNFEVTILIEDKEASLRPGMNATANIITNVKENVIAVPIQAVTARKEKLPEIIKSDEEQNVADAADEEKSDRQLIRDQKESNTLEEVVFVVNADSKVERRKISKGISNDDYYEVLEGLSEGDKVVIGPFRTLSQTLKDGKKVREKKETSTIASNDKED